MSKFALLFLMTYAGGLIAIFAVDAVWGFYLYELVYFLNPQNRWWSGSIPSLSYSFLVSFLLIAAYAINIKNYKEIKIFDVPITKWMLLLLAIYWLGNISAVAPRWHMKVSIELTKLMVMMFLGYKMINDAKKLDGALWAYLAGACYIGMEARRVGRNYQGRVEGIGTVSTDDANGIAVMLAPTVAIVMYFLWRGNKWEKFAAVATGAFIFNGLVLINSRGAFLAAVAAGGYFIFRMFTSSFQRKGQKKAAILIVLASLSGALYLTDDTFWERMQTLQQVKEDKNKSGASRVAMWVATFDLVEDYPFGVGAAGFQVLSKYYVPEEMFFGDKNFKAVHSMWFQALSEIGWPGFFVFMMMLYSCYRLSSKTRRHLVQNDNADGYFKVVALEAAFLSFLTGGTFIDQCRAEVLYWLMLFLVCAANIYMITPSKVQRLHEKNA